MHDRLRRLLYEAFFGVVSTGPAPDFRGYGRPRLMLVNSAWRSGMSEREDGTAGRSTAPHSDLTEDESVTTDGAERAPASGSVPSERKVWVKPSLQRMP